MTARARSCNLQWHSGLCGGICRIPFGLRRIAMDFLRNCGAEQKEVKPPRSHCVELCRSGGGPHRVPQRPLSAATHSATSKVSEHVPAQGGRGTQYHFLQFRWTSKILLVQQMPAPPLGPPFARHLTEHTEAISMVELYCCSGSGLVLHAAATPPRGW